MKLKGIYNTLLPDIIIFKSIKLIIIDYNKLEELGQIT